MSWKVTPADPWTTQTIELDPYLAWQITHGKLDPKSETLNLHVLIELTDTTTLGKFLQRELPASPRRPPGFPDPVLWARNIEVFKHSGWFYGDFCTGGGFVTAKVSPLFFTWLHDYSAVLSHLVRGVTLSRDPDLVEAEINDPIVAEPHAMLKPERGMVVLGVIDDAIPFAHARFRFGKNTTRWLAAWLQDRVPRRGTIRRPGEYGLDFAEKRLNRELLAAKGDELRFARAIGQIETQSGSANGVALLRRASHGAMVADLLGGYELDDTERMLRPLIGVQLPRRVSRDSSGLSLAAYVFDAVLFIIRQAENFFTRQPDKSESAHEKPVTRLPIVINLSYAVMSGAHDDSGALGRALAWIAARYHAKFTTDGSLSIVLPAGNSYQTRGHARLSGGEKRSLPWRILPDDETSSFVECWLQGDISKTSVTLEAPDGAFSLTVSPQAPCQIARNAAGDPVAMLKIMPPVTRGGQTRTLVLATVSPTLATPSRRTRAPHGLWHLKVGKDTVPAGLECHCWILRDEAPMGFEPRGRQSFFDDPEYIRFGNYGRINEVDSPAALVKRMGTCSGIHTGAVSDQSAIVICGGHFEANQEPVEYSGAGTPIPGIGQQLRGPDATMQADQSHVVRGVPGSGTRSGSFVALSGTSVSAPQMARFIAGQLSARPVPIPKAGAIVNIPKAGLPPSPILPAPVRVPDHRIGWGALPDALDPCLSSLRAKRRKQ